MAVSKTLNMGFKLLFVCCISIASTLASAQLKVATVAGGFNGNGGLANSAAFAAPGAVAVDNQGRVYIGENLSCQIRRINATGVISKFAGKNVCGFSGDGGPASAATFTEVTAMAFDNHKNLIVADSINLRIRKIDSNGIVTTVAGNGTFGHAGDGGQATQASLGEVNGVTAGPHNGVYFSDSMNVVRMIDSTGVIHAVSGTGTAGFSGDNGPASAAQLSSPQGLAIDAQGNLYIADENNNRVRKVAPNGTITTFAGNGMNNNTGSGGPATSAALGNPLGLVLRGNTLYISTFWNLIWALDLNTQVINIVAGDPSSVFNRGGFNGDGNTALTTLFFQPEGIAFDAAGNLFVADQGNNRVRKINLSQTVSTVAGGFLGDGGQAKDASLNTGFNVHIAFDAGGNLYVADTRNNRVRKINPSGVITTFAGTGLTGYSGDGGPAASAAVSQPNSVTVDNQGNVFIADTGNNVIRKVDTAGTISTFATPGPFGFLSTVTAGLTTDTAGNLYTTDGLSVVWKIDPSGNETIFAGMQFQTGYNGDGIPATQANLNFPSGLAFDQSGNMYISEWLGNRIRKVDLNGIISTIAGTGAFGFSGDGGPATSAALSLPFDVAVDPSGNIFIADFGNARLREIDGSGTIQTMAGTGAFGFNGNHMLANSTNVVPTGLAIKSNGTVFFTDENKYLVRKLH
jgi:sugar lactone lactonase YvrE